MLSLRLFAFLLLSLACRELAGSEPIVPWQTSLLATGGLVLGFGLLFKSFALAGLCRPSKGNGIADLERRSAEVRRLVEIAWCFCLPAVLLATGWLSWLGAWELAGLPQSLAILGCFLPTAAFIVLIEITAAQVDAIMEAVPVPIERASRDVHAGATWQEHLQVRLRLGEFAGLMTCVTPVLLIAISLDLTSNLRGAGLGGVHEPLLVLASGAMGFLVIVFLLPSWLSHWSGASAADTQHCLPQIARHRGELDRYGIEVLVIRSHQRWAGAAIVGWIPGFRKLWLGDALLDGLDEDELDMVILHELAHVVRKHAIVRMLPLVLALLMAAIAWSAVPRAFHGHGATTQSSGANPIGSEQMLVAAQWMLVCLFGSALVWLVGFTARLCELDADRVACRLAREKPNYCAGRSPQSALASALAKLMPDARSGVSTWLHPSLECRLGNLEAGLLPGVVLDS